MSLPEENNTELPTGGMAKQPNEVSSISIPPRTCRQVAGAEGASVLSQHILNRSESAIDNAFSTKQDDSTTKGSGAHLTRAISLNTDGHGPLLKTNSVDSLLTPPNASTAATDSRPKSITIKFYRRPMNPILISNHNTGMPSFSRQDSPKISNGSACLSLVKPSVQAQECSSEDLTVTVPPIRSEVVLNVNSPQSITSSHIRSPECPRPQPGPLQSGPTLTTSTTVSPSQPTGTQNATGSPKPEATQNSSNVKPHIAHFNLPRVRPYRTLFPVFLSTSSSAEPSQAATGVSQATLGGQLQTSTLKNSSTAADQLPMANNSCNITSNKNSFVGSADIGNAAITAENNVSTPSAIAHSSSVASLSLVTMPKDALSGMNAGKTLYGPRSNFTSATSPSPTATCSSSPSTPVSAGSTVSNLPPRPPSLKKPNLGPLQPTSSTTSLASPSTSSPLSHISPSRRSLGTSPSVQASVANPTNMKTPPGMNSGAIPITSTGRSLPPLQTGLFQHSNRRPSISSQDSVSSCLTPTKSTPPSNLPMGRFPCLQSPSANPGIPPFYQQHGVSPVTSPYQDSPSNSRPPSWYGYRMFRGRDSSPSATSRDSLDSFIRSPPSGIFCTRSSVDNLIASRSSMDNISDTSGDSVFDDIMSESEKKSLDDTAESVGSLGSLNIADTSEGAVCLNSCSPGGSTSPPDGAASHSKLPSSGRISKRDSMMSTATTGETASSNLSDVEGVPSMPATPPISAVQTNPIQNNQGQVQLPSMGPEPPPSYEEAIGLVPEGASSSHLLTYKDFVPAYSTQRRTWEPFNKVVLHANEWLVLNPEVRISSCESVLGFAAQSHGFNPDRAIGTRSQVVHENTYNLRFLRIWYSRLDQTSSDIEPQQIRYANFVSPAENASVTTLVELINTKLNTVIKGDLLNVETLYILRKAIQCPDTSCWIERPHDPKSYSFFLRVFWLEPQEERQQIIKLGYMDFVPQHASGKNYPNDYEPFSVLIQVAQWWATHKAEPGAYIINCQSLYVKRKALSTYWQRLHYTESAGGNNFLKNTYYNQILRIYFQTPTSCLGVPVSPTLQISCRTFTPVQLTSPTDPCLKFESFGETVNRVLHWLRLSGAQLMSIETIRIRMYGGLQGPHGAESTLMRSEGRRYSDQEHWLHCLRVYLVGEYQEPDSSRIPPIPHVVPYFTTSPRPIALQPPTVAFL